MAQTPEEKVVTSKRKADNDQMNPENPKRKANDDQAIPSKIFLKDKVRIFFLSNYDAFILIDRMRLSIYISMFTQTYVCFTFSDFYCILHG